MKVLAVILVFLLAVPPVQGGFCDMGGMDAAGGAMDTAGNAGVHASMRHGTDGGPGGQDRAGHACCAPTATGDAPDGGANCADMPCGSCSLGVQAVPVVTPLAMPLPASRQAVLNESCLSPSHASPPFRPPATFS